MAARLWHTTLALIGAFAVVAQLVLTVRGVDVLAEDSGLAAATPERIVRFFSYFTIQSNLLCLVTSALLAVRPHRDGRLFRIARLDALVGITVTFVVYLVALAPLLDLSGITWLTDQLFHIVVPVLFVLGWVLFGPRPRTDRRTLAWALVWPAAYVVWVLVLGALSDWYPYPFVDVVAIGYPAAIRNGVVVLVVLLAVAAAYRWLDGRLPRRDTASDGVRR